MSGHHPFRELIKDFSPARQAQIAATVQRLQQETAHLELQQARQQAQAELATRLHVLPPDIAQLERRTDLYITTLRRCLEALGGTLEIVAHVPAGHVTLTTFSPGEETEPPPPAARD